jgi:alanine-glyoxylate transaminase/serine-glyoxylate transaminase/serine-pyruvate transaminase
MTLPVRLLAGGGPASPDPRVLRALTTPLIGQFDPAFTAIMDDVVDLARQAFLSVSPYCFGISALAAGGLEAALNSLLEADSRVVVTGDAEFVRGTAELVRLLGAQVVSADEIGRGDVGFVVVPFGVQALSLEDLVRECHRHGARVIVDATFSLCARELRVDDWGIDLCVAGVDHAVGAPSGMSLVTYAPVIHEQMQRRRTPPKTSYLDLLQLQAYWSAERLNHHTAPTSLVYALREALRLMQVEGNAARWHRHAEVGWHVRDGLQALGLTCEGVLPYSIVRLPTSIDEPRARDVLRDRFGVHVVRVAPQTWRLGLLGADARTDAAEHVLASVEKVLAA